MKTTKRLTCSLVFLTVIAFARMAPAQDTNGPGKTASPEGGQPDMGAMIAMMVELAKPGENHKILADMTGKWTAAVKYWMSPDTNAPPTMSTASTIIKPIMGGRYFISEHKGMMSMPGADGKMKDVEFNGMEIGGYDNVKKLFVSSWIDNMGTSILQFEGTYDAATKAITYTGEEEPVPGMKSKVREVITITDNDHHTMEYFEEQAGHEVKTMEINYTRVGG